MDPLQGNEYSAEATILADLPTTSPAPHSSSRQTPPTTTHAPTSAPEQSPYSIAQPEYPSSTSEWLPATYSTMPVDTEYPTSSQFLDPNSPVLRTDPSPTSAAPFGVDPNTQIPYQYPSPPPLPAQPSTASNVALAPQRARRSTTSSRRQATEPAYKTTDRHRQTSKIVHAQYKDNELEKARSLHDIIPVAFHSQEAIRLGGTKEKTRAMDEAMAYIAHLEGLVAGQAGGAETAEEEEALDPALFL